MLRRETLEAAAKAAGLTGTWRSIHQTYGDQWVDGLDCGGSVLWNSFDDDGDAHRLAAHLSISVAYCPEGVFAIVGGRARFVPTGLMPDRAAAARRAITLLAGAPAPVPDCPVCGDSDMVSRVGEHLVCGRCHAGGANFPPSEQPHGKEGA